MAKNGEDLILEVGLTYGVGLGFFVFSHPLPIMRKKPPISWITFHLYCARIFNLLIPDQALINPTGLVDRFMLRSQIHFDTLDALPLAKTFAAKSRSYVERRHW